MIDTLSIGSTTTTSPYLVAAFSRYARQMTKSGRQNLWPVLHYEDTNRDEEFLTRAFGLVTEVAV